MFSDTRRCEGYHIYLSFLSKAQLGERYSYKFNFLASVPKVNEQHIIIATVLFTLVQLTPSITVLLHGGPTLDTEPPSVQPVTNR